MRKGKRRVSPAPYCYRPRRHKPVWDNWSPGRDFYVPPGAGPQLTHEYRKRHWEAIRLYAVMPRESAIKAAGVAEGRLAEIGEAGLMTKVVTHLVKASSAGTIGAARRAYGSLCRHAGVEMNRAAADAIDGDTVVAFLEARDADAADKQVERAHAMALPAEVVVTTGAAASVRSGLRWLSKYCCMLSGTIDVPAVKTAARPISRASAKQPEPLSLRMVCALEHVAVHGTTSFIRGQAAGWARVAHGRQRFVSAQRSRMLYRDGDYVTGYCGREKNPDPRKLNPKFFYLHVEGVLGDTGAHDCLAATLKGLGPDVSFMLRETDSPDGDPQKATKWLEGPIVQPKRALQSLRALVQLSPYGVSANSAALIECRSPKGVFPTLGVALEQPEPVRNETGGWAGSLAQDLEACRVECERAAKAKRGEKLSNTYGHARVAGAIKSALLRQLRAAQTAVKGVEPSSLPEMGGYELIGDV